MNRMRDGLERFLGIPSPHYPVVPAPEFRGKTAVGDYGDFVFQADWTVGQVLAALDRTKLAENTLVIFTSDNGPEITGEVRPGAYDRVQQFQHHRRDGLRGAKRDLWEGGHRVPFVARWPTKIPAGSVSEWKAHFMTQTGYGQPKEDLHDPRLLFHLGIDPGESRNVAGDQAEVLAEIRTAVQAHQSSLVPGEPQLQ